LILAKPKFEIFKTIPKTQKILSWIKPAGLPNLYPKFQTLGDILSKKSDISFKEPDTTYFIETVFFNLSIFLMIQEVSKIEPLKSRIQTEFFEVFESPK